MTYSTDARFVALVAAYTALVHALIRADTLDSLEFERSAALARSWLARSGAEPDATTAFDDIIHGASDSGDWRHPPL